MKAILINSPASVASSVGSVTSALQQVTLEEKESHVSQEVQHIDSSEQEKVDAARWQYVKGNLYKQLGYTSPLKLQVAIDECRLRDVPESKIEGAIDIPRRKSVQ